MVYVLHNSPSTNFFFFFGMFSKLLEKYEFPTKYPQNANVPTSGTQHVTFSYL